jgi:hypothetical protein
VYPGYHDLYYSEKCHFSDQIKEYEISGHAAYMDGNGTANTKGFSENLKKKEATPYTEDWNSLMWGNVGLNLIDSGRLLSTCSCNTELKFCVS